MKKKQAKPAPSRWWIGLVVAAVVIVILGFKLFQDPASAVPLSSAPEMTTVFPLPPTAGPASAAAAAPPTAAAPAPGTAAQSDPFPQKPGDQIKWVQRNKKPAMLLYHSTNCKPCILMDDLVKKVRADYEPEVAFVDIITNNPANADVVRQSGINLIPTTFFVTSDGQSKKTVGAISEDALRAELNRLAGR
jgi:thiol-disulfide isomerase/thioredoxin